MTTDALHGQTQAIKHRRASTTARHRLLAACALFMLLFIISVPSTAFAWPLESEWISLTKATNALFDPTGDSQGGNNDSRDIVGSTGPVAGACTAASCPTAYLFNDGTYIYFRLRLNADPRQGGGLSPFGWGLLIDTNGVLTDYEWLIMVNGINNPDQIEIDRNVIQGAIDSPSDKAEVVGWSETAVDNLNYRVTVADSTFLSNPDYFLDFRFPYTTFRSVTGLTDSSPVRLFVGTSNNAQVLTADLGDPSNACTLNTNNCTISGGISDTVLPLGTQPATGSVLFVSDLTGTGDSTSAYQGQTLYLKVTDADRNTSSATSQTLNVTVTNQSGDSETVTLTETGASTGIFTGSLATTGGMTVIGNGTLQVAPIETVTVVYVDAIDANLKTNQTRIDTLAILPSADLGVTMTASSTAPGEGEIVDFTLTVWNYGPNTAAGIQITDLLPAGVTYESDSGAGFYNRNTGIWETPSLVSGASSTLVISVRVQNGTSGTTIANIASITASALPDPLSGNNTASRSITVGGADLSVMKAVSNAAPSTGGSITYSIAVRNSGTNNASGVQVTDLLPAGVSYTSHAATQGTYTAGSGIWAIGGLSTGSTSTLTITASVTAATGDTVTNTAAVTASDQGDGNTANNTASTLILVGGADLAVGITVSNASPNEGNTISYQVVVANNGPGSPSGIQVTDLLPAGLTFVSALASVGTYASGTWTIGALATSATLTINATVNAGTNGQTITNTAAVTASSVGDPVAFNNSAKATLTVQRADVAISKLVSTASPTLGASIFYTVVARNNGPNAVTSLQVTDLLPVLVTFASYTVSPPGSIYTPATGLWSVGTLASGATATLRINATVSNNNKDALATVINTATKTGSDQADPVTANDASSATFTIQGCDLAVAKTVSTNTPAQGSTVAYTISIRNNGPFTSDKNVTVYDVLPQGLNYVSAATTAGSYNSSSGIWDLGNTTLASGATHTLTITATVTGPTGSVLTNAANNPALYDIDLSNNLATVPVYVGGTDISVTKSASDPSPNVGGTVTYTVAVHNNGPNDALNLVVADLLASGLTYTSSAAGQGIYDSGTGLWSVGTLATGATTTLSISAIVNAGTGGSSIVNTAFLQSMTARDTNSSNDTASAVITVQAADLYATKTASNLTPNELDPIVYSVTITNNGPSDASNVVVRDLLASGLTYSSHVVSQGTYSAATGVWNVGAISKSASKTLQVTVKPNIGTGGTNIPNTAAVTAADQADADGTNNSATITITPVGVPIPNIVMLKTAQVVSDPVNNASNPKAIPGAVMLYSATMTNTGNGRADAVVFTDPLSPNTSLFVGDMGGAGTGPVLFTDGAVTSGLSYVYSGLGSGVDSISFSNNGGAAFAYTPVPDANGFDSAVTHFRITFGGSFDPAAGASQPSLTLQFKVRVK